MPKQSKSRKEVSIPQEWFEGLVKARDRYVRAAKEDTGSVETQTALQLFIGYIDSVDFILKKK